MRILEDFFSFQLLFLFQYLQALNVANALYVNSALRKPSVGFSDNAAVSRIKHGVSSKENVRCVFFSYNILSLELELQQTIGFTDLPHPKIIILLLALIFLWVFQSGGRA